MDPTDPTIVAREWQQWSPLANALLTLWWQGEISAPTARKIAHAAKLFGCATKDDSLQLYGHLVNMMKTATEI